METTTTSTSPAQRDAPRSRNRWLLLLAAVALGSGMLLVRPGAEADDRDLRERATTATRVVGVVTAWTDGVPARICVDLDPTDGTTSLAADPAAVQCGLLYADVPRLAPGDSVVGWTALAPAPGASTIDAGLEQHWLAVLPAN